MVALSIIMIDETRRRPGAPVLSSFVFLDRTPLRLEAATLSRIRSAVTSRSNCAKDKPPLPQIQHPAGHPPISKGPSFGTGRGSPSGKTLLHSTRCLSPIRSEPLRDFASAYISSSE